jgi:hypothetical protein
MAGHVIPRFMMKRSIRDIRRMMMPPGAWNPEGIRFRFAEIRKVGFVHLNFHISAHIHRETCDMDRAAGFQSSEHRPESLSIKVSGKRRSSR